MENVAQISAVENPDLANHLAAAVQAEDAPPEMPPPPRPAGGGVTLPAGLDHPTRGLLRDAEVRELTGEDEEKLARTKDVAGLKSRLLELGVTRLGDTEPPSRDMLDALLIGDRDFLILKIRQATYGDEIELSVTCPTCAGSQEIIYSLEDDVPIKELDGTPEFDVNLRNGRVATVTLPCGADEQDVLRALGKNATRAEINTLMLGRCLQAIDGEPTVGESTARSLGMADRRALLDAIADRQVGPQFGDVTYSCAECGTESPLVVDILEMFRG